MENVQPFQIFVKPTGATCNLHCHYCYYINKESVSGKGHAMEIALLEQYIQQHFKAVKAETVCFSWHGGEPLMAGIDFYQMVLELQKKYCPDSRKVINGIQTNGTLIDTRWAEFLSHANFMVGLSCDGPEYLHNRFRKTKTGEGTFKMVMRAYDLLVMHGTDPEMLCVVNRENSGKPLELYRFFKSLGAQHLTFIPLVEYSGTEAMISERSVRPSDFGTFLCTIFDEWLQQDIGKIKIQIFEESMRPAIKKDHSLCIFKKECGAVPVLEKNGDVYVCDHFVNENGWLGNLRNYDLTDLLKNDKLVEFGNNKSSRLPSCCRNCDVLEMCHGECPKNRFICTPQGEPYLNYLCEGYRTFFRHCKPMAEALAKVLL